MFIKNKSHDISYIIQILNNLARKNPNFEVVVETLNGIISAKLSDANIYEDIHGNIVIDCE